MKRSVLLEIVPEPGVVSLDISNLVVGFVIPIPTDPLAIIRSLSVPSVVTLKCPSEPVSTTSADVFPSEILSVTARPTVDTSCHEGALELPLEANI